jgi:dolichyl-phosphate-mannose--protein O-mannosyl transferase
MLFIWGFCLVGEIIKIYNTLAFKNITASDIIKFLLKKLVDNGS